MSEYNEEVVVNITADLTGIQQDVTKLADSASALPESLNETRTNVDSVIHMMNEAMGGMESGLFANIPSQLGYAISLAINQIKPQVAQINQLIGQSVTDINVNPQVNQQLGFLAANLDRVISATRNISALTNDLTKAQIDVFNHSATDIQQKLLVVTNRLNENGSLSDRDIRSGFLATPGVKQGLSAVGESMGWTQAQQDKMLETMISLYAPTYSRKDYYKNARIYAGEHLPRVVKTYNSYDYKERLPERFKNMPVDPTKLKEPEEIATEAYQQQLSKSEHEVVLALARENESFRQSLIQAGIGAYSATNKHAGQFIIPKNITRLQLAQAEGFLFYDHLKTAWESDPVNYKSLLTKDAKKQKSLTNSTSKTVVEGLNALEALAPINEGITPVYAPEAKIAPYDGKNAVKAGKVENIKNPRYMVMSLSPSDFVNGKMPDASEIVDRTRMHKDNLGGGSKYVLLNRSLYTDLAGMHGDNTAGNGIHGSIAEHPEMLEQPPMLILDFGDDVFEKDEKGEVIWENGAPKADSETMDILKKIFSRDEGATIPYTYNGEERKYAYPVIRREINGQEQRYVPTNIKGGGVYLLPEDVYTAQSKKSLEALGVNIFDNFADVDAQYDLYKDANKIIEAANRSLTPSIPFEELGGVNPDASKIGFVKMKNVFGHDGSIISMPGYIPGGDGILRMAGIKGVGQEADYKRMIKDAFKLKDGDPFYMPGLNVPKELEDIYDKKGIQAILQDSRWGQSAIDQYFVDIMRKDMLIPDSVIKTPLFSGMSSDQAAATLDALRSVFGGFRVVATAKDQLTKNQIALSKQFTQNLVLTDEEVEENAKEWDNYIDRLKNDPEAQKEYVFNQKDNPLDIKFRENPSLIESNHLMQVRLKNAIESAERARSDLFAKDQLSMRMAAANPVEWILKAGQRNGLTVADKDFVDVYALADDAIGAIGLEQNERDDTDFIVGGGRYPNTPNEAFPLVSSGGYRKFIRKYRLSPHVAYANTKTLAEMGGGDFDGDTIQFIVGKIAEKVFPRTKATRDKQIVKREKGEENPLKMPTGDRKIHAEQYADMLYRQIVAPIYMGRASVAIDALSQGNWDDEEWVRAVGSGAADLRAIYDIDSTFAKTGVLAEWSSAANEASMMGRPFTNLLKDFAGAIKTGNFDQLKSVADYNFPSAYSSTTALALSSLQRMPMSNESIEKYINEQRLIKGTLPDLATAEEGSAEYFRAKYYDSLFGVFGEILRTGSITSDESLEELSELCTSWDAAVKAEKNESSLLGDRKEVLGTYEKEINRARNQLKNAQIVGLTESAVAERSGFAVNGMFDHFSLTGKPSVFKSEVMKAEAKNDRANIERMAIVATDPELNSDVKRKKESIRRVNNLVFSYTMLDKYANSKEHWYDEYVERSSKEKNTPSLAIGKAFHSAAERFGDSKIANQGDPNAPVLADEQLVDIFMEELLKQPDELGFTKTEDGTVTHSNAEFADKIRKAIETLKSLPKLYEDYDFLGTEIKILMPWLGTKINDNEGIPVNTLGYIDALLRKRKPGEKPGEATGDIVIVDYKATPKYVNPEQFLLYAMGIPVKKDGEADALPLEYLKAATKYQIRMYADDSPDSMIEVDITDEAKQSTKEKHTALVSEIQDLGRAGKMATNPFTSSAQIKAAREKENEHRKPLVLTLEDKLRLAYQAAQEAEDNKRSEELRAKYKEQVDEMAKTTGKGMAIAMSLQTDITGYEEQMRKMQSQFISKARKKEDDTYNPWDGYADALHRGFKQRQDEFIARGADSAQQENLTIAHGEALESFRKALSISSIADIQELNKELTDEMGAADGETAVSQYSKEFTELTKRVYEAKGAYETLKKELSSEAKISPEDKGTLEAAARAEAELNETVEKRKEQLREKSKIAFFSDAKAMSNIAQYGEINADLQIAEQIDAFEKKRQNNIAQANEDLKTGLIDKKERDMRVKMMENIDVNAYRERLQSELYTGTQQKYDSQIGSLEQSIGKKDYFSQIKTQSKELEKSIDELRHNLKKDFDLGKIKEADYNANLEKLDSLEERITPLQLGFTVIGEAASRAVTQFAHRMFSQAVNEAQNFTVTYDAAMTEIQMVTLKTEEEIDSLGDGLIDKAIELRAGVSEVTSAATSLYRQGLSDEQVNERLEDVIKFSKTANVSTTDAIKLVTVATNNGVDSPERVFDVVSALGDSAATEAAEITKGLQKSLPAASDMGVSFEDLVAMLTVITAKTQLSGNVAGTTMRNVFSRLNRFSDVNGTYADSVRLLKDAGIEISDSEGKRSGTNILAEIGAAWEDFDDATKSAIAFALGGTEQYSNVLALLQGFSEVDPITGENLMEQLLETANNSEGITSEKYLHQIESLDGALTNLKSTFDKLVESAEATGVIVDFIDFVSDGISGFAELNTQTDGWISKLIAISTALIGIVGLAKSNPFLLAAIGIAGGTLLVGNALNAYQSKTTIAEQRTQSHSAYQNIQSEISQAKEINERRANGEIITDEELAQLKQTMATLIASGNISFDGLTDAAGNTVTTFNELAESADATAKALDGATTSVTEDQKRRNVNLAYAAANKITESKADYEDYVREYKNSGLYQFTLSDDDENEQTPIEEIQSFKASVEGGIYHGDAVGNAVFDFVSELIKSGKLDGKVAVDSNDDVYVSSYMVNGEYTDESITSLLYTFAAQAADYSKKAKNASIKDYPLLSSIFTYANDPALFAYDIEDAKGYGDYNRDDIYQAIIGREDVEGSGFEDLLLEKVVEAANLKYADDPEGFQFNSFLNGEIFAQDTGGWREWLRKQAEEEYTAISNTSLDNGTVTTDDNAVTKLTKSANKANALQNTTNYETELSKIIFGTRGFEGSAIEKFEHAASIIASVENWDDMIQSKESSGLVKAWRAVTKETEDGGYEIWQDVDDAAWEAFQRELEAMYERTAILSSYRPKETIATSAVDAYASLIGAEDPYIQWQSLSPISAYNELLQKELISILGEDAVSAIVNGTASDNDKAYYESLLHAYSAQARVDPGENQDAILSMVKAFTGTYPEQMKEYNALQSEQTNYERAKYSMGRIKKGVSTDEDYSQLATVLGMDAETIQKMAKTKDGKKQLEDDLQKRIDLFTDTLNQALFAMIPEDVALTNDMDISGVLNELEKNVTDDVFAIINAIIGGLEIAYEDGHFIVPVDEGVEGLSIWETMKQTRANYNDTHRDDEMLREMKDAVSDDDQLAAFKEKKPVDDDWASFNKNYPLIAAAFASYGTDGESYINRDGILTLINQALYDGEKTAAYYGVGASAILGEEYENGGLEWNNVLDQYAAFKNTDIGAALIDSMGEIEEGANLINLLNESLETGSIDAGKAEKALEEFNDSMGAREITQTNKYKKNVEKLASEFEDIAAGGMDAANAMLEVDESVRKFSNTQWALDQFESGNRSNKVVDTIAEHFNVNAADLKKASSEYAKQLIDIFRMGMEDEEIQLGDEMTVVTSELFSKALADIQSITGEGFDIGSISIGGVVDVSKLISAMDGAESTWAQAFVSFVNLMASKGATLTANVTQDENNVNFVWDTSSLGTGGYKGSYGSGGSKKSNADKLTEKLGHGQDLYEHQIKMVQYEQTKYQNADELGNYGKMIEEEIAIEKAYLPVLESNMEALKKQLSSVKKGSEDWYKLRDAILEAEEQYKEINNTIDENEKKLKENQQTILKLHTDLEEMVVSEIELRIENEKDMLDGSVSMQDTILNAIKQRYQDEWDLIKKDIEKKKEALQEEKNLIDERLDARREAEDEAAKYEELAELKKQLSLISMDSTRTKDAAELRESIAELEKEIGWDIAEKEAENEKNAIQDQIDAYDDYITNGDEELSDWLEDANNFSEEVNAVLQLNQTELFEWLKQNVKEYANSLDDAQKQMVQKWEETYKQMLGITDTYWDKVNAILSGKDTFLEYMKQSDEYIYASEDERKQLLYQWEEAYDKWQKAQKSDADYSHGDSGLGDWSGSEYTGSSSSSSSGSNGSGVQTPQTSTGETAQDLAKGTYTVKNNVGKMMGQYAGREKAVSAATSAARTNMSTMYVYGPSGQLIGSVDWDGSFQAAASGSSSGGSATQTGSSSNSNTSSSSKNLPETGWPSYLSSTSQHGYYYKVTDKNGKNVKDSLGGPYASREKAQSAAAAAAAKANGKYQTKYFKYGGIADFTGPAWLDGTKQKPERILNADQTEDFETLVSIMDDLRNGGVSMNVLRDMARWSSTVSVPSSLSYVGSSAYGGNSASIGDVFVNITQAQISDDRDIEELANIVGEKFVKEIGKQGINVSRYNF